MYTYPKYICTNQFCYGFNIRQHLETSPHENQNAPTIDDFLYFTYISNFKALFGTKYEVFITFIGSIFKGIFLLKFMLISGFFLFKAKISGYLKFSLSLIVKGFPI